MATLTITRRPSDTLLALLDEELAFSPSFRGRYSNHLAMSLVALDQMGASAERLRDEFDAHARAESEPRTDVDDLAERRREVERDGIEATVRRRVPALVAGPASQLFHPLIRLAYGIEAGHAGQVAAALLDWERRLVVLPVAPARSGSARLRDVAEHLAASSAGAWPHTRDLAGVARRPEMVRALDDVALDNRSLDDLSSFVLAVHVTADDFFTLHMVTGARALRVVAGVVDPATARALVAHAIPAMAVVHAAVGAPPILTSDALDELRGRDLPTAGSIAAAAIASRDPHVIKLANVGLAEEERTGDPLHRLVAARVVGLAG
jgi:hypothetical protein